MGENSYLFKRPNHAANLNDVRISEQFSDVIIKVKDKEFRAHRVILFINLKFFKSIFLNMDKDSKNVTLCMTDLKGKDLEPFLAFAYTGQMLLTDRNVIKLLKRAVDFGEDDVLEACIQYLITHVKPEQACLVYRIANAIRYFPLMAAARSSILNNFQNCSQTVQFLKFDFEILKDILTRVISNSSRSYQIILDVIISWILYDLSSRQMYIYNLLDLVDITELSQQDLLNYVRENIQDDDSIVTDILYCYQKQIEEKKHDRLIAEHRSLMAVGKLNGNLHVQYYSSFLKKWSEPREIINTYKSLAIENGTILDKTFYNLIVDTSPPTVQLRLVGFSTLTRPNTTLISSKELLRSSAICASSKFVYLCGGQNSDRSVSDRIITYNPQKKVFKFLPPMPTKRRNAIATFGNGYLYVLGGLNESAELLDLVEMYDPSTKKWSKLPPMSTPRRGFGVAVLDNELYVAGGMEYRNGKYEYLRTVEVYNRSSKRWRRVASMTSGRFKFDIIAYKGKLLTVGEDTTDTEIVEVYDPTKDQWKTDRRLSEGLKLKYPIVALY